MTTLRLALLADGAGDRALVPVLTWALRAVTSQSYFEPSFECRRGEVGREVDRVSLALRPDILFVHRDAEREPLDVRRREIPTTRRGVVRVVPVRMTEAWLLGSESAIRKASGNPNGSMRLEVPSLSKLESLPNPKQILRDLLLFASGHTSPRRRRRFQRDIGQHVLRVAEFTDDFSPLRQLTAYRAFEEELRVALS
jgi:hypothetical protein